VAERAPATVRVMGVMANRDVRLMVGATGISALGDFALGIPIALEVRQRTGSALAVAAFFLALYGPIALCAGVAGRLVDRVESRRLLIVVSALQALAAAVLLVAHPVAAMLALTALIGCGVAVAAPAEFALLPIAAGEAHVAAANGWAEGARGLGLSLGPVLGGALAAAGSFDAAVAIDLASFAVVALAAALVRARRVPAARRGAGPASARGGLAALTADRELAAVVGAAVAALAFFSISMTAEVFFVVDVLHAGQAGFGVAIGVWTAGMTLGSVALARRVAPALLAVAATAAIAVQGAGLLGASLATTFAVVPAGFALGGVAHGVKNVAIRTLIHARVPDARRGRAYAAYNGVRNAAELGAIAVGGVLVGAIGARASLALAGAVPLALGVAALARIRAGSRAAGAGATTATTTTTTQEAHP
jgi:MFS family permease